MLASQLSSFTFNTFVLSKVIASGISGHYMDSLAAVFVSTIYYSKSIIEAMVGANNCGEILWERSSQWSSEALKYKNKKNNCVRKCSEKFLLNILQGSAFFTTPPKCQWYNADIFFFLLQRLIIHCNAYSIYEGKVKMCLPPEESRTSIVL